jgi:hypothetical protein
MKKCIITVFILSMFYKCAPQITRTGYEEPLDKSKSCDVIIKENAGIDESIGKVIGEIDVDDNGFSINCGEKEVLLILKQEACSIRADMINLEEIKRPDIGSSCYRVKAQFIRLNEAIAKNNIESSESFSESNISKREHKDAQRNTTYIIISVLIGALVGFLVAG